MHRIHDALSSRAALLFCVAVAYTTAACGSSTDEDPAPDVEDATGGGDVSTPDAGEEEVSEPDDTAEPEDTDEPETDAEPPAEICDDGIDNDGDGLTDCDDPDCEAFCAAEDLCPEDATKTEPGVCGCGTPDTDSDNDGTPDCIDACPRDATKVEAGVCGCGVPETDTDGDGTPDCIDACPDDPAKTEEGFCGCGESELDSDFDGTPDCVDACPFQPLKTEPGVCGCEIPDVDTDGDGTLDCEDLCPDDGDKTEPGLCGCGRPDTDTDDDGTPDCFDLCPEDETKVVLGFCGCGVPETDTDGDGTPDCADACPDDPLKIEEGLCGCGNRDDLVLANGESTCTDLCPDDPDKIEPLFCGCGVPETDSDGDGLPDCRDECPDDPDKFLEGACGCGIPDTDGDGDGTADCIDACPDDHLKTTEGACGCGVTDIDSDADGVPDCVDECPDDRFKSSPGVCGCGTPDTDTDEDGTPDCIDPCFDDPFGDIGTVETAESLSVLLAEGAFGSVTADASDLFTLTVCPGAQMELRVTSDPTDGAQLGVFATEALTGIDTTIDFEEGVTVYTFENPSVEAVPFYFEFSTEESCATYSIELAKDCLITCDDPLEENDTPEQAVEFGFDDYSYFIVPPFPEFQEGDPVPPMFPFRASFYLDDLIAADADYFAFEVCPFGSATVSHNAWVSDGGLWFGEERFPFDFSESSFAQTRGVVFGEGDRIVMQILPDEVQVCNESPYFISLDLECTCGTDYYSTGEGFMASREILRASKLGGAWSAERTSNAVASVVEGSLCEGGTLRATLTPRVDDPTLRLKLFDSEGLTELAEAVDDVLVWTNEGTEPFFYQLSTRTIEDCSAFDLTVEHEGCVCEDDTFSPNHVLEDATPLALSFEVESGFASLSQVKLSSDTPDWYRIDVPIECEGDVSLSIDLDLEDFQAQWDGRVYDAVGTLLAERLNGGYGGLFVDPVSPTAGPFYVQLQGASPYTCSAYELNVGMFCANP